MPNPVTRPIDIGYRARKLPAWLGELAQEKWNIGQCVAKDAPRFGLTSYGSPGGGAIVRKTMDRFMTRCKATLGVESGSSVFDFSGEVQRAVEADVDRDPRLTLSN